MKAGTEFSILNLEKKYFFRVNIAWHKKMFIKRVYGQKGLKGFIRMLILLCFGGLLVQWSSFYISSKVIYLFYCKMNLPFHIFEKLYLCVE